MVGVGDEESTRATVEFSDSRLRRVDCWETVCRVCPGMPVRGRCNGALEDLLGCWWGWFGGIAKTPTSFSKADRFVLVARERVRDFSPSSENVGGEKEEGAKRTVSLLPELRLRVRRRWRAMYAITASTRNSTPPRIPPIMGPRAGEPLELDFAVVLSNIAIEVLDAGVRLLFRGGEGTVEMWNLLIVGGALIR